MTGVASRIALNDALRGMASCPPMVVSNLRMDSRSIEPGDAFVALAGARSHGLEYAHAAIERGAVAILHDPAEGAISDAFSRCSVVPVPHLRAMLGEIADRAYGSPSARLEVVGVTGTNGKTTCAWLYALSRSDRAAYLGTLGAGRPPLLVPTTHTTADVCSVHCQLAAFVGEGISHLAMEVSSHALDQGRIEGVRMPITAFTNLTRDHLDYHGTMTAYGAAKAKLLQRAGVETAVINGDDSFGAGLIRELPSSVRAISVSVGGNGVRAAQFLHATRVTSLPGGLRVEGMSHHGEFDVTMQLIGSFNAENGLVVLGMLLAAGLGLDEAVSRLSRVTAPPGRMELFAVPGGPLIVVDYAHTPDALEKALVALRQHVTGALYCVFGCGGDRDAGKRPLMARVAAGRADHLVITDDNPRFEDPETIITMICRGIPSGTSVAVERNREKAIRSTVSRAKAGDVVLIAGKGHETVQIVGDTAAHFSDREIAADLVREAA